MTLNRALPAGTMKNREAQAFLYVKFMLCYGLNYLSPEISDLAMYYQFLANTFKSPGTVKNHASGAKAWVQLHRGNIQHFEAQELGMMSKSIVESSNHVPDPAAPLTPQDIRAICTYIDTFDNLHPAYKAAILLAFATFLRVSNVLCPTRSAWGGGHTLLAQDIKITDTGLLVIIRSTKTRRHGSPHVLQVMSVQDSSVCPVRAWKRYYAAVGPCPLGPAFMFDDYTPLTPGPVVRLMRLALQIEGRTSTNKISFHSLRRGAAQTAAKNGATQEQIMEHGTWKSVGGVQAYLNKNTRMVPAIIAKTLAK